MEFISDILLGMGALAAAVYCVILSKKLNRLSGLDQELGTAIALLSRQVDEMTKVLESAQTAADGARSDLQEATERAEVVAAQLQEASEPQPGLAPAATMPPAASQTQVAEIPAKHPDDGGLSEGSPSLFMRHGTGAS